MDGIIRFMVVYHGTDYENAKKICSEGFTYKPNKEHWLGNGVYFFMDRSLAKWWTTNPTDKFGDEVKKPVIICCNIRKCKYVYLIKVL